MVEREAGGDRAIVGVEWFEFVPSSGIVYDPDGLLADQAVDRTREGGGGPIRGCRHVHGPWHWCRLY